MADPWVGFLEGPSNTLAVSALRRLARDQAEGLVPMVLHGPAGCGKTRLLRELEADWILQQGFDSPVLRITGHDLAARAHEAAISGDEMWSALRAELRHVRLLMIDDVRSLDRRSPALSELGHALDDLTAQGASIVVTATTPPGQWKDWPIRIVHRFLGGALIGIDPPDLGLRRRFLLERSHALGIMLGTAELDALAARAQEYRTLEGELTRLAFERQIRSDAATPGSRLAADFAAAETGANPRPSMDSIARAVGRQFGISLEELRSASRRAAVVRPRQLAMFLARRNTGLSLEAIGAYFGGRDAATVRHGIRLIEERIPFDPGLAAHADMLQRMIINSYTIAYEGD